MKSAFRVCPRQSYSLFWKKFFNRVLYSTCFLKMVNPTRTSFLVRENHVVHVNLPVLNIHRNKTMLGYLAADRRIFLNSKGTTRHLQYVQNMRRGENWKTKQTRSLYPVCMNLLRLP